MLWTLPRALLLATTLAAIAPLAVEIRAQAPATVAIDVQSVGPKIGERVPQFTLRDQTGAERSLTSIMGPKGAMLVFFRSADW